MVTAGLLSFGLVVSAVTMTACSSSETQVDIPRFTSSQAPANTIDPASPPPQPSASPSPSENVEADTALAEYEERITVEPAPSDATMEEQVRALEQQREQSRNNYLQEVEFKGNTYRIVALDLDTVSASTPLRLHVFPLTPLADTAVSLKGGSPSLVQDFSSPATDTKDVSASSLQTDTIVKCSTARVTVKPATFTCEFSQNITSPMLFSLPLVSETGDSILVQITLPGAQ